MGTQISFNVKTQSQAPSTYKTSTQFFILLKVGKFIPVNGHTHGLTQCDLALGESTCPLFPWVVDQ